MNRFVAGDRAPSSPEGAKMLACVDPTLDCPVILFQDVIKILHRSMSTLLFQNSAGFELGNGWRISSVLVGIDDPRRGMVLPAQGFGQKALAAAASRLAERRNSIVAPVESTARYKYTHLPLARTYVSSTRQESFVALSRLRRRRFRIITMLIGLGATAFTSSAISCRFRAPGA